MMWDVVMAHVKTLVAANTALNTLIAGNFRKAGVSEFTTPVLEWSLLGDTESELWAPMLVQFDVWTDSAAKTRRAERLLRGMFHRNTSFAFDGYTMLAEYAEGADLATPTRASYTGRAVRFRLTPLRQQYAQPDALML